MVGWGDHAQIIVAPRHLLLRGYFCRRLCFEGVAAMMVVLRCLIINIIVALDDG